MTDDECVELVERLDSHDEALVLKFHLASLHILHLDKILILETTHKVLDDALSVALQATDWCV